MMIVVGVVAILAFLIVLAAFMEGPAYDDAHDCVYEDKDDQAE